MENDLLPRDFEWRYPRKYEYAHRYFWLHISVMITLLLFFISKLLDFSRSIAPWEKIKNSLEKDLLPEDFELEYSRKYEYAHRNFWLHISVMIFLLLFYISKLLDFSRSTTSLGKNEKLIEDDLLPEDFEWDI